MTAVDDGISGPPAPGDEETLELHAFPIKRGRTLARIEKASRWRDWINGMDERWGNRCLPLLVANESGWVLLNPLGFEATWGGDPDPASVRLVFDEDTPEPPVHTHFGYGILTWGVPYLFRTPPGYNLLARGPANWPKDGVAPLEGLVETDWSVSTFTMNWKLTRPGLPVRFEADEPFCMILPQRRGDLEQFEPRFRDLQEEPELHAGAEEWARGRDAMLVRKFLGTYSGDFSEYRTAWEQNYFRGTLPDGSSAPDHQTRRRLAEFGRTEPDEG